MATPYPVVIEHGAERLTDREIKDILLVSRTRQAFIQIVEEFRQQSFLKAPTYADDNNPLALARELGGAEMCSGILMAIQKRIE